MSEHSPATLRLIAEQSGVSMTTVSKILRGKYKGNTPKGKASVEAVSALARKVGYIANGSASRLRDGRHRAIVALAPVDPYGHPSMHTFEYITGIAMMLNRTRYALSLHTYPGSQPELAIGRLSDRNFDAAIVLEDTSLELDRFMVAASIPAVHINIEPARGRFSLVRDEYHAARELVELIAGLGYRRIHLVGTVADPHQHFSNRLRHAGIADAVAATQLTVTFSEVESWTTNFETVLATARIPADTMVVAMNASNAIRAMRCLPYGQPLACCDDSHLFSTMLPGLTRATFDRASLARTAVEYLLKRIEDPTATLDMTPVREPLQVGTSTPSVFAKRNPERSSI